MFGKSEEKSQEQVPGDAERWREKCQPEGDQVKHRTPSILLSNGLDRMWVHIFAKQAVVMRSVTPEQVKAYGQDDKGSAVDYCWQAIAELKILCKQGCGKRDKDDEKQEQEITYQEAIITYLDEVEQPVMIDPHDAYCGEAGCERQVDVPVA